MTAVADEVVATSPLPPEVVEQYGGKWVALRASEVVAAADDFDALVANDEVLGTDTLVHVPENGTYFF